MKNIKNNTVCEQVVYTYGVPLGSISPKPPLPFFKHQQDRCKSIKTLNVNKKK